MAALFNDANTQFFEVDSAPVLTTPLTMACWFTADTIALGLTLVALVDKDLATQWFYLLAQGNITGDPIAASARQGATIGRADSTTGYAGDGTWQHAAAVFATTTSRTAYLDGGSAGSNTTLVDPANIDRISVGRLGDSSPSNYHSGDIAEVAVWDTNLTAAEITELSKRISPLAVRPQNLVYYDPIIRPDSADDIHDIVGGLTLVGQGGTGTPVASAHPSINRLAGAKIATPGAAVAAPAVDDKFSLFYPMAT